MNDIEVIGIDHGWMMMKTPNYIFKAGIKEISKEPPFFHNILEYNGAYYEIDGKRAEIRKNKVENDNYYLLTLAAIAKELRKRGKHKSRVLIAAGLPLTRFGDEKDDFVDYLKSNEKVSFKFEQESYEIEVVNAAVFPQCYAAVLDKIPSYAGRVVVVDVGSWTIDIMAIENRKPVNGESITIPNGLITCIRNVNSECYRQKGEELDESIILDVMRKRTAGLDDAYLRIINDEICRYVDSIYNSLREYKYGLNTTQMVFVGGGAGVIKNFGNIRQKNISYETDIRANAKGFEYLGKIALRKMMKSEK